MDKTRIAICEYMQWKEDWIGGENIEYFTESDRLEIMGFTDSEVRQIVYQFEEIVKRFDTPSNTDLITDALICPFCIIFAGRCEDCTYHDKCDDDDSTYSRIVESLNNTCMVEVLDRDELKAHLLNIINAEKGE